MKKAISNLLYITIVVILCFSTIYYYQENNRLIQTTYTLENENKNLEQVKKELLSSLENTNVELQQLKSDPLNLIIQIRNFYENKNYEEVKKTSEELHALANGSDYDIEAQNYVKNIQEIENKSDIQKAKEIIEITNTTVKHNYTYTFFDNMSVGISYKINSVEKVSSVNFSISALNSKNEVINFNTGSSMTKDTIRLLFPTTNEDCTNTFEKEWNNLAIKRIIINSITVNYYDGSKDVLERSDNLNYIFVEHKEPVEKSSDTGTSIVEKTEETVYITSTGTKYHKSSCSYLNSRISITKNDAIKKGYTACSRCNP